MTTVGDSKPIITFHEGKPYAVFCGVCEAHAQKLSTFGGGPGALESAIRAIQACCLPKPCDECNEPVEKGWAYCRPCRDQREHERFLKRFASAEKIAYEAYGGEYLSDGEEYFPDASDEIDEDKVLVAEDGTRFLWGTYPEKAAVDLERECGDNWLSDHYEGAFDQVNFKKLRLAQTLVDEALAGITTYHADQSIAVILPPLENEDVAEFGEVPDTTGSRTGDPLPSSDLDGLCEPSPDECA